MPTGPLDDHLIGDGIDLRQQRMRQGNLTVERRTKDSGVGPRRLVRREDLESTAVGCRLELEGERHALVGRALTGRRIRNGCRARS